MKTGIQAWKLSKGLYLIPLLFAYQPEILFTNGVLPAIGVSITGLIGLAAGVGALDGYLVQRLNPMMRCLMASVTVAIFMPNKLCSIVGVILFFGIFVVLAFGKKRYATSATPEASIAGVNEPPENVSASSMHCPSRHLGRTSV